MKPKFPRIMCQGDKCLDCDSFTVYDGNAKIVRQCKCGKNNGEWNK